MSTWFTVSVTDGPKLIVVPCALHLDDGDDGTFGALFASLVQRKSTELGPHAHREYIVALRATNHVGELLKTCHADADTPAWPFIRTLRPQISEIAFQLKAGPAVPAVAQQQVVEANALFPSAFAAMMGPALPLPRVFSDSAHRLLFRPLLYNDLLSSLTTNRVNFPSRELGIRVLDQVVDLLWTMEPSRAQIEHNCGKFPVYFTGRSLRANGPRIEVADKAFETHPAYNSPHRNGGGVVKLVATNLSRLVNNVHQLLQLPFTHTPEWSFFREPLAQFVDVAQRYVIYLADVSERMKAIHNAMAPARSILVATDCNVRDVPAAVRVDATYADIDAFLQRGDVLPYTPIDLNDFSSFPLNSHKRTLYLDKLRLSVPCQTLTFSYGNYLGCLYFVWSKRPEGSAVDVSRAIQGVRARLL